MVSTRSASASPIATRAINIVVAPDPGRPSKRARVSKAKKQAETEETAEPPSPPPPKPARKRKSTNKPAVEPSPEDFPKRAETPWKAGAHVSAAGGVENAILNAAKLGANAFALFLKSQRKWDGPPLSEASIATFQQRLKTFGYSPSHVLPHGSYLVNMGNPDSEKREKSYQCFVDELKRCEQLGLVLYNFHPGSTVGAATVDESVAYIAECINRAHKETTSVVVVVENMAGAGNVIGGKFEELAGIIDKVEDKTRVGICLDTCHLFAAGYDIRTKESWSNTMKDFDNVVGLKYLRGMHLNDSKEPLGSKKDRHENIGLGELGLAIFAHIMTDERTQGVPLVLETPVHDDDKTWQTEIEVLNGLATGSTASVSLEEGAKRVKDAVAAAGGEGKKKGSKKRKKDASVEDGDDDGCI